MPILNSRNAALVCVTVVLIAGADAPRAAEEDATLGRYKKGRAALALAIEAIGGYSTLRSFTDVSFSFQAIAKARGQSAAHDVAYTTLPATGEVTYESSGRIRYDYRAALRGGREFAIHRAFDNSQGWTYRLHEDELSEMSALDLGFLRRNPQLYPIDALPHSLILSALGNAASIRIGDAPNDSDESLSIEFSSQSGAAKTLVIDAATGLPRRMEYLTSDPLLGDTQGEVHFAEYRTVDGIRIPYRLSFTVGGEDIGHWTLSDVRLNTSPNDEVFMRPDIEVTQPMAPFQPQQLADGVYAIRLYSGLGFTYNTMLVELDDYFVVVEAPLTDFFYNIVKGLADRIAPDKPIKYVVSTHYHFDHTGGVKSYLASGATVLTGDDNARFLARASRAQHTLIPNPLRGSDSQISIETVQKARQLGMGSRSMRLIDMGPNPHVDEILVAYLPAEKILFVSDLLSSFDSGNMGPPTEALLAFNERLESLGIDVATFVPGHGPVVTREAFRRALEEGL